MEIRHGRFDQFDADTLYRILRLRAEVFVVEQACVFNDLDGRDRHTETIHLWIDGDPTAPTVTAAMRLLREPDRPHKISRVVTAPAARHGGVAAALIDRALSFVPKGGPVTLDAQDRLAPWYARWGFVRDGPDFDEDGIIHTPMRRP